MKTFMRHAKKASIVFSISKLLSDRNLMVEKYLQLKKMGYDADFVDGNLYAMLRIFVDGEWMERQLQIKEVLKVLSVDHA